MSDYCLKNLFLMKKIFNYLYIQNTYNASNTKFNETESCIRSHAHFLVDSRLDDFSVISEVWLDAQTLVLLLLLELISPCLAHRQLLLCWYRLIPPSENRQRCMGKRGICSRSISTVHIHCRIFPTEFNVF